MHTITRAIDIAAPPEVVWDILTDQAAYPEWNPFIRRLQGTLEPGVRITVRITPPNASAMTFTPTIIEVEPERRLAWRGRLLVPGLFDGLHSFTLEPLPQGGTRFVQQEVFRGILVSLAGKLLSATERGFAGMNGALAERAEKQARA